MELQDLLEIQKKSYQKFLEEGIKEVFEELFPVESFTGNLTVDFGDYSFDEPRYSVKEEKENTEVSKEEPQVTEEPKVEEPLFKEMSENIPVETPHLKSENVEAPMPTVNNVLNEEIPSFEEPEKSPVVEDAVVTPKEEKEFDFDALAAAITKELESIEKKENTVAESVAPVLEETKEEPLHFETDMVQEEIKVEEPKEEIKAEEKEVKKEEPKTKRVMPTVFSSVYVNRSVEEPKILKDEIKKAEEPKVEEAPLKAKIELPKTIDLPKPKANPEQLEIK